MPNFSFTQVNKMMKFALVLCLAVASYGATIPRDEPTIENYIVGGQSTPITELPYQVAMYKSGRFMCGGSIVSPTHIVTAAHCTQGQSASTISFRAGSARTNEGGVVIPAKTIYNHPKYNPNTMDFDVAIVELSKPLSYSSSIKPIRLATSEPRDGSNVRPSGWGLLRENGPLATTLQSVQVPVINRNTCASNLSKYSRITPRMICAGVEGRDSCQGDSGGPLNANGELAGIVSFGIGCARRNLPGVYTNVANPEVAAFIKKIARI